MKLSALFCILTTYVSQSDTLLPPPPLNSRSSGFTLVELAIVLVIIGLLAGGVLVGRDMIRAAELQSLLADHRSFLSAVTTFHDRYRALPGDMPNATAFWGTAGGTGTGAACFNVESTSTATCNGNNDGVVNYPAGATGADVWRWGERFAAAKHLANATLISGTYTGRTDSTTAAFTLTAGKNVPPAKLAGGYWEIIYSTTSAGTPNFWPNTFGHNTTPSSTLWSPLTPGEAYSLDTKADDGKPATGTINALPPAHADPDCTSSDDSSVAIYLIANTGIGCTLGFRLE